MQSMTAVRNELLQMAEPAYAHFSSALLPGVDNLLGVRLPVLRQMAKKLAKQQDYGFLAAETQYFEETMLQGMVIGYLQVTWKERQQLVKDFIPKINNWSVCDSFCSGLKFSEEQKETVWRFLMPYTQSSSEYEVRFAVVMMLHYFMDKVYLPQVLAVLQTIRHDGIYAKMAVSWALCECFVHEPERTCSVLRDPEADRTIIRKAVQKITESKRASAAEKKLARSCLADEPTDKGIF